MTADGIATVQACMSQGSTAMHMVLLAMYLKVPVSWGVEADSIPSTVVVAMYLPEGAGELGRGGDGAVVTWVCPDDHWAVVSLHACEHDADRCRCEHGGEMCSCAKGRASRYVDPGHCTCAVRCTACTLLTLLQQACTRCVHIVSCMLQFKNCCQSSSDMFCRHSPMWM